MLTRRARVAVKREDVIYEQPMVVPKVVTFSMERRAAKGSAPRQIVIWVLGAAAWYALSPSPEYRAQYDVLVEKAQAWLFLEERYAKFRGRGKTIKEDVADVFGDVSAPGRVRGAEANRQRGPPSLPKSTRSARRRGRQERASRRTTGFC